MVSGSLRVLRLLPPLKTGHHDIAKILLKVALNTINQSINIYIYTVNSFNFVGTNFRGLGKKRISWDSYKKFKKSFEILKFVDFHFKFVDFACRDSTVKCSF